MKVNLKLLVKLTIILAKRKRYLSQFQQQHSLWHRRKSKFQSPAIHAPPTAAAAARNIQHLNNTVQFIINNAKRSNFLEGRVHNPNAMSVSPELTVTFNI